VSYFTERVPTRGEREIWVEIRDGSSPTKARRLPYLAADIPVAIQSEVAEVFVQGELISVHRATDVIPTGSVTFPLGSFLDSSTPTVDEIIGQTGTGTGWTPTNDMIDVPVSGDVYNLFTVVWHNDARKMGGSYTTRTCTGCYLQRPATSSVAAPTQLQYSLKVYGTITDAVVSVS
jgi:hypothetical protein